MDDFDYFRDMKVGTIWEFGNYRGIVKIIDRKGSIVTEKVIAHIVQSVVNDVEDMDTLRMAKGYWKKVNNLARLLYE